MVLPSNSQPERNAWFCGQAGGQASQRRGLNPVGRRIDQAHHQPFVGRSRHEPFQQPLARLVGRPDHAGAGAGARPGPHQFLGQDQGVGVEAFTPGGLAQPRALLPQHGGSARLAA